MIRVLHVLGGLDFGGAETLVMNLYRNIDCSKIQFDFIVHTEKHQAYYDEIISLGGRIYHFPRYAGYNTLEVCRSWHHFFKEHPEYKILHSHVRSYASLYLPIAKKYGLKTIIHSHSTSNGSGFSSIVKRAMQYPLRFQADYFMGCSMESGRWLFGSRVVQGNLYYIVKNAIDVKEYCDDPEKRAEYRKKFNIENKKIFIHVGRLHPAKNHMFLIDVFAELHGKDQNTVLVLVGDGELRAAIQEKIKALQLGDSVMLLGNRNDVPALLNMADCFLFPSLWEGLPLTVIEAQAAGLPCFVSDTVTDDVCVSDLVYKLPIDQGENSWVQVILNENLERKSVSKIIIEAGFDVRNAAEQITEFYIALSDK